MADQTNLSPFLSGEGSKNVAAAGTPVALSSTSLPCRRVTITARPANTKPIAFGFDNSVRATAGSEVGALLPAGTSITLTVNDASKVWVDAGVNGEGVTFTYDATP